MEEVQEVISKSKEEIEQEISRAMRSRLADFKEKADSLTLEGVRRALEKDLGMTMFSLDAHKRFIKQCVEECFYGADDENQSKTMEVEASMLAKEEPIQSEIINQPEKSKDSNSDNKEADDHSCLAKEEPDSKEIEGSERSEVQNGQYEDRIKEAIKMRAAYFRENTEHITPKDVRRTLEEDLKLEKNALDAYKSLISEELDKVLCPPEVVKSSNGARKMPKKASQKAGEGKKGKGSKRARQESNSSETDDSASDNEEDEEEEDPRPKKNTAKRTKGNATGPKRQKKSADESKSSFSKPKNPMEPPDEGGSSSEDGHSDSSAEEQIEKKSEKPTQVYGKKVEHLKSVIKSCGMGITPSIYKKVKQAPESKREAYLIKELEEILRKEGLSSNPSEKDIKAVRKRKERTKELEGIDMSNIVSSSRRRTTSSYIPPPKPKIEDEEDDDEDEEDEEDEEGEDGEDTDDGDRGDSDSNEASDDGGEDESD